MRGMNFQDIAPLICDRKMFSTQQAAKAMAGYASSQLARMESPAGYDPKMASHALRVLRMGLEFSQTGTLKVRRSADAWELLAVKWGEWSAAQVREEAERLFGEFSAARNSSALPERANVKEATRHLLSATFSGWSQPEWQRDPQLNPPRGEPHA